ncbi:cadherin-like beta sandwich domain-containing protein [Paenibacillus sp. BAC0078]
MRLFRLVAACLAASLLFMVQPWIAKAFVADSDAALSAIYQAAGELSPAFSPEITEYQVTMRSSEPGYFSAATSSNPDAAIEYSINGSSWSPMGYWISTGYLPTNRGDNTFRIKVTSTDATTSKIYTLHIYYPHTNDSDLRGLSLSTGNLSPAFHSLTTNYTVNVPFTSSSVSVNAILDDPAASMKIEGQAAQSGVSSPLLPLSVGSNSIEVETRSQDSTTTKTYSLTVNRAAPSTNANLSALSVSGNSLTPAFQSGVTDYSLNDVYFADDTISVTPLLSDSTATVAVRVNGGTYTPTGSGALSNPLALQAGDNTIDVKVTAQDGLTVKTYQLNVHRKSNNTNLSNLDVAPGALNEVFAGSLLSYTMNDASYDTDTLTVTLALSDPSASAQIKANNGSYTAVTPGQGVEVPLLVGRNTITIKVLAEDKSYSKLYTITVRRVQDSTLSPASSTFDKYTSNTTAGHYRDVTAELSLNGNLLTGLMLGTKTLDNTAYTVSGSTLTITKEYLSTLAIGDYEFELVTDAGSHPVFSVAVKDTTPTVLVVKATGDAAATLAWTPVSGATGYTVYASTVPGTYGTALATLGAGADSYSAAGLTNGTTYYFVVKAVNAGGVSAASNEVSATPQMPAPGSAPMIQSVTAGDGQVHLVWDTVGGATGYTIYQSTTSGDYKAATGSVTGTVYSYDATGLTNGTTYYFVVKAVNAGGISAASNEVSATPQMPAPGAPFVQSAVPGDRQVRLGWKPVAGASGYTIYQSTVPGKYDKAAGTVTGSVYSYDAAGLVNGTTYYFVVKAINAGGDSAASNEASATPRTVPSAPSAVSATPGDGQVTVAFTAPADNGGSAVTSYEVIASPGNIVTTGMSSPITVTGLVNGTAYTFTVRAINGAGRGPVSELPNPVTPQAPSSGNEGPAIPAAPLAETPAKEVAMFVNGRAAEAGSASTRLLNNQKRITLTLDQSRLNGILAAQAPGAVVSINFNSMSDIQTVELNGQLLQDLQQKQATLSIQTDKATYSIPVQQISWTAIANQLGESAAAADVTLQIVIAAPEGDRLSITQAAAAKGKFSFLTAPLDFSVNIIRGNAANELSSFSAYVKRTIALPAGTIPGSATGVVIDADGTVRHVPTAFVMNGGIYTAIISSLTNSTYAVVSHPLTFKDVAGHWAKDAVNDLGARMIIGGSEDGLYLPDQEITRSEFAAILVRGLGLKPATGTSPFTDVSSTDWYNGAVHTAYVYHLISGFEDGTFRPNGVITREEAMKMIAEAMILTGLSAESTDGSAGVLPGSFADAGEASLWAVDSIAASLQAGIVSGRSSTMLAPKAHITRAEAAVMLRRLLQNSGLIGQ